MTQEAYDAEHGITALMESLHIALRHCPSNPHAALHEAIDAHHKRRIKTPPFLLSPVETTHTQSRLHYVVLGNTRSRCCDYYLFREELEDINENRALWIRSPPCHKNRMIIAATPPMFRSKKNFPLLLWQSLEVSLDDISGVDYYNGVSGGRLALEVRRVKIQSFATERQLMEHYQESTPSNGASPTFGQDSGVYSADAGAGRMHTSSTILQLFFLDPSPLPLLLREVLQVGLTQTDAKSARLLRLYEQGMPSWGMFLCRWGLYYRRWLRLVVHYILHLFPIISLGCGLYDMYRNMPYVREFMRSYFLPLHEWMESHVALQIGMLVTYLVTIGLNVFRQGYLVIVTLFEPLWMLFFPIYWLFKIVFGVVRYFWAGGWVVLTLIANICCMPFQFFMWYLSLTTTTGAGTVTSSSSSVLFVIVEFWSQVARPVKNVLKGCYDTVVHIGTLISKHDLTLRRWFKRTRPDQVVLYYLLTKVLPLVAVAACSMAAGLDAWGAMLLLAVLCATAMFLGRFKSKKPRKEDPVPLVPDPMTAIPSEPSSMTSSLERTDSTEMLPQILSVARASNGVPGRCMTAIPSEPSSMTSSLERTDSTEMLPQILSRRASGTTYQQLRKRKKVKPSREMLTEEKE